MSHDIKSNISVIPMIYMYITPEIERHNGWIKIGYTEKQDVETRVYQQTHSADIKYEIVCKKLAVFDDGSGDTFTDKDFHRYLETIGIKREEGTEWFEIDPETAIRELEAFKSHRGVISGINYSSPIVLRKEQKDAVLHATEYIKSVKSTKRDNERVAMLWNIKPRGGKTIAAYSLVKEKNYSKVLIITNRPAVSNSWYEDYLKMFGDDKGCYFVSELVDLKGKAKVLTRSEYCDAVIKDDSDDIRIIELLSLQDMKGSIYFGGAYDKLSSELNFDWDIVIIDESHDGVDTKKTEYILRKLKAGIELHLSGTSFKAIENEKFAKEAIFNYTYVDEQRNKQAGCGDYQNAPVLNLQTFHMSNVLKCCADVDLSGETDDFSSDINEFFKTKLDGSFVHEQDVITFIEQLHTNKNMPFSSEEKCNELNHTMMLFNRVDSVKAFSKLLKKDKFFSQYKIVEAVGQGVKDEYEEKSYRKAFDAVKEAHEKYDKTIILSVGQLTMGVNMPKLTGLFILSSIQSPALYMQSAFRVQTPCLFKTNNGFKRKENAYIFDYCPSNSLRAFEAFANDLISETAGNRGTYSERKANVEEMLKYFPVVAENEYGDLVNLTAEDVLSLPRKLDSKEVVRRGFMHNILFTGISNLFRAPMEAIEIIKRLEPTSKTKKPLDITKETSKKLSLNSEGNVELKPEHIAEKKKQVFVNDNSETINSIKDDINNIINGIDISVNVGKNKRTGDIEIKSKSDKNVGDIMKKIVPTFMDKAKAIIIPEIRENYSGDVEKSVKKDIDTTVAKKMEKELDFLYTDFVSNTAEKEAIILELVDNNSSEEDILIAKAIVEEEKEKELKQLEDKIGGMISKIVDEAQSRSVKVSEELVLERQKNDIEELVRDYLKGFARTIPSFIMACDRDDICLENFEECVNPESFKDLTGITIQEFKFLKDGGTYYDEKEKAYKYYKGHIFDSVVFNDSVKEFLRLKYELSDYFTSTHYRDIFSYIPPQRTNQIFTPKHLVITMVEELERQNPGCFDNPNFEFFDPHMKSGMYIAEIVKRLFNSEKMKQIFPNDRDRLKHIFEKQVYGFAPTQILYDITRNYLLGFDFEKELKHNFKCIDWDKETDKFIEESAKQGKILTIEEAGEIIISRVYNR